MTQKWSREELERAHEHYLAAFTAFSDIQEERPASLAQLEEQCCG